MPILMRRDPNRSDIDRAAVVRIYQSGRRRLLAALAIKANGQVNIFPGAAGPLPQPAQAYVPVLALP